MINQSKRFAAVLIGFLFLLGEGIVAIEFAAPSASSDRIKDGFETSFYIKVPKELAGAKRVTLNEFASTELDSTNALWEIGSGWNELVGKPASSQQLKVNDEGGAPGKLSHKGHPGERYSAFFQAEIEDGTGKKYFSEPLHLAIEFALPRDSSFTEALPLPAGSVEDKPLESAVSLARREVLESGSRIVELQLGDCIGAAWSLDGKYAFFLERPNILRQVEAPSMEQKLVMKLPAGAKTMGMSAQGLVVTSRKSLEVSVAIYDPETFKLKRRLPEFEGQGKSFVSSGSDVMIWVEGNRLVLIDLLGKSKSKSYMLEKLWAGLGKGRPGNRPPAPLVTDAALSPNGKDFFTITQDQAIVKHSMGDGLGLEAVAISESGIGYSLKVAPNSKFVMVSSGKNNPSTRHPRAYSVNDFSKPTTEFPEAFTIPTIFAPARRYFAAAGSADLVGSFDARGRMIDSYSFRHFPRGANMRDVICPRTGSGILLKAEHHWFFFEPGEDTDPAAKTVKIGKPVGGKPIAENGWKQTKLANIEGVKAWSGDGKSLYCLSSSGRNPPVLRRISYPEFVEEQRLYFDRLPSVIDYIGESKAGLALNLPGLGEIWILDPITFKTIRKIFVPIGVIENGFVASPTSEYIFAPAPGKILAINAETGTSEPAFDLTNLPRSKRGLPPTYDELDLVSCQGGKALVLKHKTRVARFAIAGSKLTVEDELTIQRGDSDRNWPRTGNVFGVPTTWMTAKAPENVIKAANPKYDPSKPGMYLIMSDRLTGVFGIYQGFARIVGDPGKKFLYAVNNRSSQLEILGNNGQVKETIEIKPNLKEDRNPIVHPAGGKVAAETDAGGIVVIERAE